VFRVHDVSFPKSSVLSSKTNSQVGAISLPGLDGDWVGASPKFRPIVEGRVTPKISATASTANAQSSSTLRRSGDSCLCVDS
jgi:hypothetical protein